MDLAQIEREALEELDKSSSLAEIDSVYNRYLGRKDGRLTSVLRGLGTLSAEEKKTLGQRANQLRVLLEEKISARKTSFESDALRSRLEADRVDVTLPGTSIPRGHAHPVLQTIRDISDIFRQLGFEVAEGPEIETDENNFNALNIPADHPARDSHDTFYLTERARGRNGEDLGALLLRTQTSPVQIRLMREAKRPPIRMLCPGRVYRHEATDATHAAVFHQVEGLVVDAAVSFSDLKGTLTHFARRMFGSSQKVRFRPSYFPFVEPGAEMDVSCFLCGGAARAADGSPCPPCKGTGWIEMLGAGMVHPQVLRNVGFDPEVCSGFAFGMGVERIVMTRYGVRDIRAFLESDLRFLEQFA